MSDPLAELDAFIGGFTGESFRVYLDGDAVHYERFGAGYEPAEEVQIRPSAERWAAFAGAVDRIGVWSWERQYADDSVMDGTGWSIRLADSIRRVESAGNNAAPAGFTDLCAAISRLVGAPFR
jgi:hypothetical protein